MCYYIFNRRWPTSSILISSLTITRICFIYEESTSSHLMDRWIFVLVNGNNRWSICLSSPWVHLHELSFWIVITMWFIHLHGTCRIHYESLSHLPGADHDNTSTMLNSNLIHVLSWIAYTCHVSYHASWIILATHIIIFLYLYPVAGEDAWPFKEGGEYNNVKRFVPYTLHKPLSPYLAV